MKQFKMFEKKVYCRECLPGSHGFVNKVFIKKMNKYVYVCDECEYVWESIEDLNDNKLIHLDDFTEKYELKKSWQNFSEVTDEWSNDESLDIEYN